MGLTARYCWIHAVAILLLLGLLAWPRPSAANDEFVGELAVRSGPSLALAVDGGPSYEIIHVAPGLYIPSGLISAFYSYHADNQTCGAEDSPAGNHGWVDLQACEGHRQHFGAYYRLTGEPQQFEKWLGFGAAYFESSGKGTRRFSPAPDYIGDDPDTDPYPVSDQAFGIDTFFLFGFEYLFTERMGVGLDFQPGLRIRFFDEDEERPRYGESTYALTAQAGLRLSYKIK